MACTASYSVCPIHGPPVLYFSKCSDNKGIVWIAGWAQHTKKYFFLAVVAREGFEMMR